MKTMTQFNDAVYHTRNLADLGPTEFTRKSLRVLLLIDGQKTVADIAHLLRTDVESIMPALASLIRLGIIQTEVGIGSGGEADLMYQENSEMPREYMLSRLSAAV